ncbi:hypothetical protein ASE74_11600 [Pedobacter sp. Leaf216]|uniref:hypothetical protein n=1 Tax=Pedobacter sp. Leaf216 TaxID=1735684 RepID=UPI0006F8A091|nr:hypothetical protein [Pedobacter sp. Leaf216]KQM64652.1 hypothetical protein ASE74_11600 [Pedobacter sp. Leaf216]
MNSNIAMGQNYSFDFYNGTFNFKLDSTTVIPTANAASAAEVSKFYSSISSGDYEPLISSLKEYQKKYDLNDWIYYQLIRKTAEEISPKANNYFRYTLYKWFLLSKCGYDARLAVGNNQVIFYVRNDEDISDIPFFMVDGKKFLCLNYHDYGKLFKQADTYKPVKISVPEAKNAFSYKVTRMPDFKPDSYQEKDIAFSYRQKVQHFKLKVNENVQTIFKNYPVVDFESYFNIPLSRETYSSLIPTLKENLKHLDKKKGVDYLMKFTRYSFLYEDDSENYGEEKRFSPEQTLLSTYSDCDDRAALFFYLVKEIYDLPMIALLYPKHLTIAVQFDTPIGKAITYKGKKYSYCEPTPQAQNLKIGQLSANLKDSKYQVVYAYEPIRR